ncbi:P-loop containing nucleoside triphosphate hydrolase [Lasallia pustulata]|uniref:p-loop containing nucleoside triphosphate hydrolase n=1 Tax=Lasallia pustulata TaxID=136370 RepID=A0A1W5CRY0_9LECA|nr:P-loop containing nucleoside triphosphate hydrolase [Lasallia pustulata]
MSKASTKIQMDRFTNPESLRQLEVIDALRELGLGHDISLPQLVVVGDQSSGKSSLLEGLTGLPFPVASGLCTRFITQVIFRRTPLKQKSIVVSIVPAADADDAYKQELEEYRRDFEELPIDTFAEVLDEAAVYMGLPAAGDPVEDSSKRFANDVLKIEISGPEELHFSFADLPGLFHNPTAEQTKEDLVIIRNLIESYIGDSRTIILAILDSRNNLANQEIFRIAKAADPGGHRTIGIMTKLDALQRGDESAAMKIAQNQTEQLKHGWYCVRNRSTDEVASGVSMTERHRNERAFFATPPWDKLDKRRVGVDALRQSLGLLLNQHISREFPFIRKEIEAQFLRSSKSLEQLGAPRHTAHEQVQYLIKLTTAYQELVRKNLDGHYESSEHDPSKLRMHVQNAGDKFSERMLKDGCAMRFKTVEEDFVVADGNLGAPIAEDEDDIYGEISKLWRLNRGPELPGHLNPSVMETLFKHQTSPWQEIAGAHIEEIIGIIRECNNVLFRKVCTDEIVRDKIRARIDPQLDLSFKAAKKELGRLLKDEREGHLLTNNHYYAENLSAARDDRLFNRLRKLGIQDGHIVQLNIRQLRSSLPISNEQAGVLDIHDTLKAFYKVAIKRFIDNVKTQAIERILLGPEGPVRIFSPEFVSSLDEEEVGAIAGEDYATSNLREELGAQIARLAKARKVCS